jgi:hypothetical protein
MIIGPHLFPKILDALVRIFVYIATLRMFYMAICSVVSLYKARRVPYLHKEQYKTDSTYAWVIPSYNED